MPSARDIQIIAYIIYRIKNFIMRVLKHFRSINIFMHMNNKYYTSPTTNQNMVLPKIKLTYFDIEGRGECIRLALILSGVNFEDDRVPFPEWPALKKQVPLGTIPVMTIDDGPMRVQSKALLRWVGRNFSNTLYPDEKLLDIEEAIGITEDLLNSFAQVQFPLKSSHPPDFYDTMEGKDSLKRIRQEYVEETLPTHLKFLLDRINQNDGKWLASTDEPTIADCLLIPALRKFTIGSVEYIPTTSLDSNPAIVEYIKRFCELDAVKGRYNNGVF